MSIRRTIAAVSVAGMMALGCTTADDTPAEDIPADDTTAEDIPVDDTTADESNAAETDVAALGDLEPETCLPTDPPDEPPGAVAGVTADDQDVVDEVAEQVAAIRELVWDEVPVPTFLDPPQLAEVIEQTQPSDLLDIERRLLVAIGAIPPDFDLPAELTAFEATSSGYYLWEPPQVLLGQETSGELDPFERLVLAHELLHALSDQAVGFPIDVLQGADDDADAALAALAVIEGEATVLESFWASLHLAAEDRAELVSTYEEIGTDLELPHVVQRRAAFPYVEGRAFVCEVHRDGGWEAVDELYADVPTTTAEILTGTRVEVDSPPTVEDPGDDWLEIGRATVGAAELLWLFEAPGDDREAALDDPLERVRAWGGGQVTTWTDTSTGARDLVALALVDAGEGSAPLCDSVDAWQTAAFPDAERAEQTDLVDYERGDAHAVLRCTGDDVLLVVADEADLVGQMVGASATAS